MKKILAIATAVLLMAAADAFAQPGGFMRAADKLGLSDQQIEQLQNMGIQHQKDMVQLKADLKLARLDLKEIMMKANLNEKMALSKQEKISGIKAQIDRKKLEHMFAMRKVLNEEQLAKWNIMRRMEGPRGHDRGGPFRFKGPCPGMGPGPALDPPEPPSPRGE